ERLFGKRAGHLDHPGPLQRADEHRQVKQMQISTLSQSLALRQSINEMRAQFDDLQRQLATGLKTDSYAKLGTDRNTVLSLSHQLSQLSAYTNTISKTNMRIEVMTDALTRVNSIASETK